VEQLTVTKAGRDGDAVAAALADLQAAAGDGRNLMPLLLDAARAHVSEGEIVHALQAVWGGYRETPVF
jgi:methylmalonyl-CoA mutase N-terminal domain/subunit